jgi:Phosphatidylserine decarboxylase
VHPICVCVHTAEIKKGEELGYFQFGGSSHCVVFRKGVIEHFSAIKGDELLVGQEFAVAKKVAVHITQSLCAIILYVCEAHVKYTIVCHTV